MDKKNDKNNNVSMLDELQNKAIADSQKNQQEQKYKFDKLKMYFGEDYVINGITISQPTVGDILDVGEERFYNAASLFLYNSTSIRVMLWDNFNLDWNKVKDIEVFYIMYNIIQDKTPLNLIFKDLSFNDFELINYDEKLALISKSQNILIPEDVYMEIAEYIREMLNSHPKVEKAKGKTTKSWIIQEDRMKSLEKKDTSTLLPLVSSCVNHPGFKYKLDELKKVGICQFMDSVKRIQKYENSTAAIKGIYSGFVSAKDIGEDTLNLMGDL